MRPAGNQQLAVKKLRLPSEIKPEWASKLIMMYNNIVQVFDIPFTRIILENRNNSFVWFQSSYNAWPERIKKDGRYLQFYDITHGILKHGNKLRSGDMQAINKVFHIFVKEVREMRKQQEKIWKK